jgi:hypothetical protein
MELSGVMKQLGLTISQARVLQNAHKARQAPPPVNREPTTEDKPRPNIGVLGIDSDHHIKFLKDIRDKEDEDIRARLSAAVELAKFLELKFNAENSLAVQRIEYCRVPEHKPFAELVATHSRQHLVLLKARLIPESDVKEFLDWIKRLYNLPAEETP